jgi:hypothetical protein
MLHITQSRGDFMKRQVTFTLRFDPAFYERIKAVGEIWA